MAIIEADRMRNSVSYLFVFLVQWGNSPARSVCSYSLTSEEAAFRDLSRFSGYTEGAPMVTQSKPTLITLITSVRTNVHISWPPDTLRTQGGHKIMTARPSKSLFLSEKRRGGQPRPSGHLARTFHKLMNTQQLRQILPCQGGGYVAGHWAGHLQESRAPAVHPLNN